jgi:hypothetical protein
MARNTGLGVARGKFVVILDADDYLLPDALEAGLRELAAHPECGFSVGRREEMTYEGGPVPWGVAALPNETRMHHALLAAEWYILPPSSAMFRREVVDAVGGFQDPWGADDLDFYLRVAHRFEGWCFNEPAVTRYRRYSASSSRNGTRMLASMRAVYVRQWPLVQGDPAGEEAWHRGREKLTEIFRDCLAENLRDHVAAGAWRRALACIPLLARESPRRLRDEAARILMPGGRACRLNGRELRTACWQSSGGRCYKRRMNMIRRCPPRAAAIVATVCVLISAIDARACACCADPGEYSLNNNKAIDEYQRTQLEAIRFTKMRQLYMTDAGEEKIKGISSISQANTLSVVVAPRNWRLTIRAEDGKSGVLTLPRPAKMSSFATDTYGKETDGGPRLYKEWRFDGVATGDGIFKEGFTAPARYTLVFQGRGNRCDNASDFTHWRVEIAGKNASYAFFGKLAR